LSRHRGRQRDENRRAGPAPHKFLLGPTKERGREREGERGRERGIEMERDEEGCEIDWAEG
jgi:hypothetical protein